jgi:hypothetical protein
MPLDRSGVWGAARGPTGSANRAARRTDEERRVETEHRRRTITTRRACGVVSRSLLVCCPSHYRRAGWAGSKSFVVIVRIRVTGVAVLAVCYCDYQYCDYQYCDCQHYYKEVLETRVGSSVGLVLALRSEYTLRCATLVPSRSLVLDHARTFQRQAPVRLARVLWGASETRCSVGHCH